MQKGELSLADAASANLRRSEKEMEDLKGAFKLTKAIAAENPSFEAFDQERWWGEITQAEHKGQRFVTICKDYLIYERSIFDSVLKHIFGYDFETARKKRGILIACGILLLLCIIRGISRVIFWHESFGDGFLYPFVLFLICSAISLPVYITGKNLQKGIYHAGSPIHPRRPRSRLFCFASPMWNWGSSSERYHVISVFLRTEHKNADREFLRPAFGFM